MAQPKKMTLKKAIKVLMEAGIRDLQGAGQGYRTGPSLEEKKRLREAVLRCGKYAYGSWYELPL